MSDQEKPNYYKGQPLPLTNLSADNFENFCHQVLIELGKDRGFEITSGPLNSSDQGFDLTGRYKDDKSVICFQCKRYNSKSTGLPTVGEELAKVAINAHFDSSPVSAHYILTTGSLTKDLVSVARSQTKQAWLENSIKALGKESLKTLVTKCKKNNLNEEEVITDYINNLERIIVWSGRDIDNNLIKISSNIESIIEKHFRLEALIRDEPRPNFDLSKYIYDVSSIEKNIIELFTVPTDLPPNICKNNPSKFLTEPFEQAVTDKPVSIIENLDLLDTGKCMIIVAQGGAGKTTSLQSLCYKLLNDDYDEKFILPIFIELGGYRGDLNKLINESLDITYGHWSSLPFEIILLLDGIDEISDNEINNFSIQFGSTLNRRNVKAIITLRNTGLQLPIVIPQIQSCYALLQLGFRQMIEIVESQLNEHDSFSFIQILRNKVHESGSEFLQIPFGLMYAIEHFDNNKYLPDSLQPIINDMVLRRHRVNHARQSSSGAHINKTSKSIINSLTESIAFEVRIIQGKSSLYLEEAEDVVSKALKHIQDNNVFGSSSLTESNVFSIALHFEMLSTHGQLFTMAHDIIADCLSAKLLARYWKDYIDQAGSRIGWDAWAFAASFIDPDEELEFISRLNKKDIALAARCAKDKSEDCIKLVETKILQLSNDPSLSIFSRTLSAASILGSEACIALLKDKLKEINPHRQYNAKRFLARAGDEAYLRKIIDENEPKMGGVSGGTIAIWFESPMKLTTKIARERIDEYLIDKIHHVPMALETLELYGDKTDIARVSEVLDKTKSSTEFCNAGRCLFQFDSIYAEKQLATRASDLEGDPFSPQAMRILHAHNCLVDVSKLFEEFINIKEVADNESHDIYEMAKLLENNTLPENANIKLLELVDADHSPDLLYASWNIATKQGFSIFDDRAIEQLNADNPDKAMVALNFAEANLIGSNKEGSLLQACLFQLKIRIDEKEPRFSLIGRICSILIDLDKCDLVAGYINKLLTKHIPIYFELFKEHKSEKQNSLYHEYSYSFPDLLTHINAALHLIDKDNLVGLIGVNFKNNENHEKTYLDIIKLVPRESVEKRISQIDDQFSKVLTIFLLSKFSKTEATKQLLINSIPMMLAHHFHYDHLISLLRVYWSSEIANVFVTIASTFEWNDLSMQMFERRIHEISDLLMDDDVNTLIASVASTTKNPYTKNIFTLWVDYIQYAHMHN